MRRLTYVIMHPKVVGVRSFASLDEAVADPEIRAAFAGDWHLYKSSDPRGVACFRGTIEERWASYYAYDESPDGFLQRFPAGSTMLAASNFGRLCATGAGCGQVQDVYLVPAN